MNQGFRTPPDIHDALIAKGFKLYRNTDRIHDYCKHVPATQCAGNMDKEGNQIVVNAVVFSGNSPYLTWSIEITGEINDGTWRVHQWQGTDNLDRPCADSFLERLDERIATLVEEWNRSAK